MDLTGRHAGTVQMLKNLEARHLADGLQEIALPFRKAAEDLVSKVADGPELTVALRKLQEAQDAAARAALQ